MTLTARFAAIEFQPMTVQPELTASLDRPEVSAHWLRVASVLCTRSKDELVAMFDAMDGATHEEMLNGLGSTEEHLRAVSDVVSAAFARFVAAGSAWVEQPS